MQQRGRAHSRRSGSFTRSHVAIQEEEERAAQKSDSGEHSLDLTAEAMTHDSRASNLDEKERPEDLHHSDESPNQGRQNHVIDIMESDRQTNYPNPSAPNDRDQVAGNQYAPGKWSETVFLLASACILAFLGISDYNLDSNGTVTPKYLFHRHPFSFHFYLIVSTTAFFLSIIAMAFERFSPALAKPILGAAVTGTILSVTVLLWALLPDELSWLPWVFFALTLLAIFGRLAYQHAAK